MLNCPPHLLAIQTELQLAQVYVRQLENQLFEWKYRQRLAQISPRHCAYQSFKDLDQFIITRPANASPQTIQQIADRIVSVLDQLNQQYPDQAVEQLKQNAEELKEKIIKMSFAVARQPYSYIMVGHRTTGNSQRHQFACQPVVRITSDAFGLQTLNSNKVVTCQIITEHDARQVFENPDYQCAIIGKLQDRETMHAKFRQWGPRQFSCAEFGHIVVTKIDHDCLAMASYGTTPLHQRRYYLLFTVNVATNDGKERKIQLLSFPVHVYPTNQVRIKGDPYHFWYFAFAAPDANDPLTCPIELRPQPPAIVPWSAAVECVLERKFLQYIDEPHKPWSPNEPVQPPHAMGEECKAQWREQLCRSDGTFQLEDFARSTQGYDRVRDETFNRKRPDQQENGSITYKPCTYSRYMHETGLAIQKYLLPYWNHEPINAPGYGTPAGLIFGFLTKNGAKERVQNSNGTVMIIRFSERTCGTLSICFKAPDQDRCIFLEIETRLLATPGFDLSRLIREEPRLESVAWIYPNYPKQELLNIQVGDEIQERTISEPYNQDQYKATIKIVSTNKRTARNQPSTQQQHRHCPTCRCHETQGAAGGQMLPPTPSEIGPDVLLENLELEDFDLGDIDLASVIEECALMDCA